MYIFYTFHMLILGEGFFYMFRVLLAYNFDEFLCEISLWNIQNLNIFMNMHLLVYSTCKCMFNIIVLPYIIYLKKKIKVCKT